MCKPPMFMCLPAENIFFYRIINSSEENIAVVCFSNFNLYLSKKVMQLNITSIPGVTKIIFYEPRKLTYSFQFERINHTVSDLF